MANKISIKGKMVGESKGIRDTEIIIFRASLNAVNYWLLSRLFVGVCVLCVFVVSNSFLWSADDVKIKLTDIGGVSNFAIQDSTPTTVFQVDSDGNAKLLNQAQLRLFGSGSNYTGFVAPASLGGNYIYILPQNFGTNGYVLSNNSGTLSWVSKLSSINGTTDRITVSGGDTVDIASTYAGQSTITTLGTIGTGTWNADTIGINKGGTGQTTANAAFNALAPAQGSQSGKFLTTNGTDTSWATIAGGITLLNSQTGATQTFANDTNVTISSATDTHTLGWTGQLSVARGGTGAGTFTAGYLKANGTNAFTTAATVPNTNGGTGLNTSASTGVPSISSGTWAVNATLPTSLGGTALNTSASTGVPSISSGTWSVNATLPTSLGGTALNTSSSTGVPSISSGTWSINATLTTSLGGTALNTSGSTGVPYISAGTWAVEAQLDETRGGTSQSTYTTGDILYASGANTLSKLPIGTTSQILKVVGGVPIWRTSMDNAYVTANRTTTSTTLGSVTDMSFAIAANEVRSFEFFLQHGCSGTGGLQYALTFPGTLRAVAEGMSTSVTARTSSIMTVSGTASVTFNAVALATGWARITGSIVNGASAGTVQLQFKSVTNGQTSTVYANSYVTSRLID